ncbi:MAG TPA: hypothetical protein VH597_09295 [Verrucomicrobiae bacterium]|jgi:hypothetical protein|nr:hypothetical protein [Verrucomicrobiae bacterium]
MKKILFLMVTALAVWAGTRTASMNSTSAQMPAFTGAVIPLTNQPVPFTNQLVTPLTNNIGFTNTLVQMTNVSSLQLSDVLARLLSLQTNIEESLPLLSFLTTNINLAGPSQTNQFTGPVEPITSGPAPLLTPTGATTGRQQPVSFSMTVGTNTFTLDPATLQALVVLRDDLELALPELQALNGTSPGNVPSAVAPAVVNNVNTLTASRITTGFFVPFTNMPPSLIPGFP